MQRSLWDVFTTPNLTLLGRQSEMAEVDLSSTPLYAMMLVNGATLIPSTVPGLSSAAYAIS
jgi:hypothetical protein